MADSPAPTPDPIAFISKPTPVLRTTISDQQQRLPATDFEGLLGAVRSAFQKYTNKLMEFPPGAERAHALHALVDRELGAAAGIAVSCHRGCCGCCHYEVEITRDEAALLADEVRAGCEIDTARLAAQAARERKSPKWLEFWSAENRCVFLAADGACRVYESRPAICRKHIVTSPPEACSTVGGNVVPVQMLLIEILLSAAISMPDTPFASMAKMVSREVEGRRNYL